MLHKFPHAGRKVSPPQPTFMSDDQMSEYLASLRNNRPARPTPTGSRPAPFKSHTSIDQHVFPRAESAMSLCGGAEDAHVRSEEQQDNHRSQSSFGHRYSMISERSMPSLRSTRGRPLARAPREGVPSVRGGKVSPTATIESTEQDEAIVYKESGTRWLEREEAHSLRTALEIMDAKEEEKLHKAAQDEAVELMWRHQHPDAAEKEQAAGYRNPDLPKDLKTHLMRGAHERSQSDGYVALGRGNSIREASRTISEPSNNPQAANEHVDPCTDKSRSRKKRLSDAMQQLRIASGQAIAIVDTRSLRNFSGGRHQMSGQRHPSNKSTTFPNSEDKIFEEPEEMSRDKSGMAPQDHREALKITSPNSMPNGARPLPQKADTMPVLPTARPNPFDRRRRQAEQPKAAPYTSNAATPPLTIVEPENVPMRDGKEIRSDDIRAATSMKRSDRSPKLPTPTAVSDRAGRPIVSFDPAWNAGSEVVQKQRELPVRPKVQPPVAPISTPDVPRINLPDDNDPYDPPRSLLGGSAPVVPTFSFNFPDEQKETPQITALPAITTSTSSAPARPLPKHTQSLPAKSTVMKTPTRLPWLNRGAPTATCASCTLPISGRIVTASDASQMQKARFHPACFTCAHCSTELESVAFYPEPDIKRQERLEQAGLASENDPLRFYCHLDFHEFYSPRCKSCKTPIEGEVILAAGGEYHVGHFFCAECGDPFDSATPFVEKDGYAYCVSCHRKRTSGRCRGCKAIILDESNVEALGGQWHETCFVCWECERAFGEEGRFYLRSVEVEVTAKERRRGIERKSEERPVCVGCEARRLKA